jgi:CubicO group peptidase (beta-lactamase class C family)
VGGTPDMREKMPPREAHPPGTFWYYNNWDFNVLGSVYERKLNKKIGDAFQTEIAAPIQKEDFRASDMYYLKAPENAEAFARSDYPAYHFRLSARDMARFGYLFLRHGNWNGTPIIPSDWVAQSTRSYSETTEFGEAFGYGYLWWVHGYGLKVDTFSARGALGKYIVVIPERDLVVALLNHTVFKAPPSRVGRRGKKASRCSHSRDEQAFGPVALGSISERERAGVVRSAERRGCAASG